MSRVPLHAIPLDHALEEYDDTPSEFGEHHFNRIDKHLTQAQKEKVISFFTNNPAKVGTFAVERIDTTDGVKLYTKNGWMLIRASGTEPIVRFYAEADSPKKVQAMLKAATSV